MKIEKSRVSLNSQAARAIIFISAVALASSANSATINIAASANIVPPIALTQRSDMRFSGFVAGATSGTITLLVPPVLQEEPPTSVSPIKNGGRLAAGGTKLVGGNNCVSQRNCGVGALQIGGPASDTFSGVSAQTAATLTSGDNTMTLDGIELRYGANGSAGTGKGPGMLDAAGNGTIVIGGVLNVGSDQAMGAYTGSVAVSVDY